MHSIIQYVLATLIVCPLFVLVLVYLVGRKMKLSKVKAFGYGADGMTLFLCIAVPLVFWKIWAIRVEFYFIIFAIIIAIVLTFVEWRSTKELEILPLLKKVWRVYFIVFTIAYVAILFVGLIQNMIRYSQI